MTLQHIAKQYFDYRPAADHEPACSRYGSDVWEVTRYQERGLSSTYDYETRQTVIRLVCQECGVIHSEMMPGEPSTETTSSALLGFGSRPVREAGLWLWAGPLIWNGDDRGPTTFFVTSTKSRPRTADDVLGVVAWGLGQRGGIRWTCGTGYTGWGCKVAGPEKGFSSRRAAVKWVAAELGILAGDQ
jgi:hypothetical protein